MHDLDTLKRLNDEQARKELARQGKELPKEEPQPQPIPNPEDLPN